MRGGVAQTASLGSLNVADVGLVDLTQPGSPLALDESASATGLAVRDDTRGVGHLISRFFRGSWALPALDFLALAAAFGTAAAVTSDPHGQAVVGVFPFLGVLVLAARGAYALRLRLVVLDSWGLAAGSVSVAAMCALVLGLLVQSSDPGSLLVVRAWLFGLFAIGLVRAGLTLSQHHRRAARVVTRRTVIVGAGDVGARLGRRLEGSPDYGLTVIGFLDDDPPEAGSVGGRAAPVLGRTSDLVSVVEANDVDHVILAFPNAPDADILPLLRRCGSRGVGVSLVPRLFELINSRLILEPVGGLPVATLHSTNPSGFTFALKHAADRIMSIALLVILAPLLIFLAGLVKLSSPGPVLFRQRRIGRDDKPFDLLKFRTMAREDSPAVFVPDPGQAPGGVEGPDRRTRIGRWLRRTSLDELPQLLNVARGEMSLVGPRPERPEYVQSFANDLARYRERHRVRAGITGLSQVHGLRGRCSIADRVELDNYYIENWSLALDLKILLLTALAIMKDAE